MSQKVWHKLLRTCSIRPITCERLCLALPRRNLTLKQDRYTIMHSVSQIIWSGCGLNKSMWQGVRLYVFGEMFGGKKHRGKTQVVRVLVVRCPAVRYPAFYIMDYA